MSAFQWDARFETGIAVVDDQHQRLVALANEALLRYEHGVGAFEDIVRELQEYAAYHFAAEEALMREAGVPESHRRAHECSHRDFGEQLNLMAAWLPTRQSDAVVALVHFVTNWLVLHILGQDQEMAAHIRPGGQAPVPDGAATDGTSSRATSVLLSALQGLYREMAAMAANLRDVNRDLEARVAERTRSLADVNEALRNEHAEQQALIRQLESTQARLIQAQKMAAVGQLAAGVAHEINNPIGFVSSNLATLGAYTGNLLGLIDDCERIVRDADGSAYLRNRLADAKRSADLDFIRDEVGGLVRDSEEGLLRVKRIVQDLYQSAGSHSALQPARLEDLIRRAVAGLRREIDAAAELELQLDSTLAVVCEEDRLVHAFERLLLNAVQAVNGYGSIRIRSGCSPDAAWVAIIDSGQGIARELQHRIFEPFFTTRPPGKGAGLGLSVAYNIVTQHGGWIDVQSTSGAGATFTIWLPLPGHAITVVD